MPSHAASPRSHDAVYRAVLSVGLLGSAATVVLQPNGGLTGIAIGMFVVCLLVAIVRALRHASRRIGTALDEELAPEDEFDPAPRGEWRRSA